MKHPFKKVFPNEVKRAAAVIDAAPPGTAAAELAVAVLDAARNARWEGQFFGGVMKDGRAVRVQYSDKGDGILGFDENQRRFEAFTSWFRLIGDGYPTKEIRGHSCVVYPEVYSQVERRAAENSGDVDEFRWQNDALILDGLGVDVASLVLVSLIEQPASVIPDSKTFA